MPYLAVNIKVNNIMNKKAFSLTELIVVISAMTFMSAIVVPINETKRDIAISSICKSRQKETGLALNLYSMDWQGVLPIAYWNSSTGQYARLPHKLAPYLEQELYSEEEIFNNKRYHCPGQPRWLVNNDSVLESGTTSVGSYGYNYFFFNGLYENNDHIERRVCDIQKGEELPLYGCVSGESYKGYGGYGGQILSYNGPHPKALKYGFMGGEINPVTVSRINSNGPAPNHGPKCNMLMADFHVEAINVCIDGEFPWTDYVGTSFHPSRASSMGNSTR